MRAAAIPVLVGSGRTALVIVPVERSTLVGGRARKRTGHDTLYAVRKPARRSDPGEELGAFRTMSQARRFAEEMRSWT